jgi:hypothetical protein
MRMPRGCFGEFEVAFTVPWLEIDVLQAVTLVASIAATACPSEGQTGSGAAALLIAD